MQFGRIIVTVFSVTLAPLMMVQSSNAGNTVRASVYGDWIPPDKDAVVRIAPCKADAKQLCGRLLKHAYSSLSQTDALNPDPELQDRDLIGVSILDGVPEASSERWKGGDLYDPRTGKSYYAKVQMLNEDEIKITGCIGPGLCKGYRWKRYEPGQSLSVGEVVSSSVKARTAQASIGSEQPTKM